MTFANSRHGRGTTRSRVALTAASMTATILLLTSCSQIERAREISDAALETTHYVAVNTLIEAQEERVRLRRRRCYSPLLTPATISDAAMDPRLGMPWVEELIRDCPQFAAFIANLVVNRAEVAKLAISSAAASAQP